MRVLVFLIVSGLAHYLAARWLLSTLSPSAKARWRPRIMRTALVLSILLAASRLLAMVHETDATRNVVALAMLELGAVTIALLPIGLLTLALRLVWRAPAPVPAPAPAPAAGITRRAALERVAGATVFGTTSLALGWGMVRGRHAFALEEVVVRIPNWPRALEGYTIAQVSDIHVGAFVGDRELDEGFELVKRIRPDLMVATGDLVDFDSVLVKKLIARLSRAGARDGAFAILGNHDHYAGPADVVEHLRASDVHVLCNESLRLRTEDGGGFALIGLDDMQGRAHRTPGFAGPDLHAATTALPPELPRILLAHQPRFFNESAGRVALQLSGHTHGGQINPGFRPADFLMDYVSGRYERRGSTLWVNRGFGVAGPPSRVGAPPEVTKIVIVAA